MIRKTVLALFALAMFVPAVMAQAPAALTVDQVVAKHLEARGGVAKIKAVKSLKATGKMSMGPMEAPFSLSLKRPMMARMEFTIQGMTGIQGFDGSNGWALMPFGGKKDPEPMTADDNFDKAYRQTLSNVRKDVKTTDIDWKTAYNEGRFAEAAQLIERLGTKASPEATYSLAICFIQQKQFDKAVAPLKRIADSDPEQLKTFTPEARLLLANVYLKVHRTADAKALLQQLVNENAPHADEAKVLLDGH